MDESEHTFGRILDSTPEIMLCDFQEDGLGIPSLSFNLNPAVVAKVSAWLRLRWLQGFYAQPVPSVASIETSGVPQQYNSHEGRGGGVGAATRIQHQHVSALG